MFNAEFDIWYFKAAMHLCFVISEVLHPCKVDLDTWYSRTAIDLSLMISDIAYYDFSLITSLTTSQS